MRHTRREVCPVCDGAGELPDDDTAAGVKLCGGCMGQRFKDVDAEAPCCDLVDRALEGPQTPP